jgi:hypothetical protein
MTASQDDSATMYHYTVDNEESRVLAGALHALLPETITWVTCEDDSQIPQQGAAGIMALFDDCTPDTIPETLAFVHIARTGHAAALHGIHQRSCHVPCRIGKILDDCLACLRLSAYGRLPRAIEFGHDMRLDWQGGILSHPRRGHIELTAKECDILMTLYEAEGNRLDRQALLDRVWAYAVNVETHTLETHIYRLRQKIEDDPAKPAIILTAGDGYALNIS